MRTQLILLPVALFIALSSNFYGVEGAQIPYEQGAAADVSMIQSDHFLHDAMVALEAGDDAVIDLFLENPSRFLGKVEKVTSFNQLYSEWHFYRQVESSAFYGSTFG